MTNQRREIFQNVIVREFTKALQSCDSAAKVQNIWSNDEFQSHLLCKTLISDTKKTYYGTYITFDQLIYFFQLTLIHGCPNITNELWQVNRDLKPYLSSESVKVEEAGVYTDRYMTPDKTLFYFKAALDNHLPGIAKVIWDNNAFLRNYLYGKASYPNTISHIQLKEFFQKILDNDCREIIQSILQEAMLQNNSILLQLNFAKTFKIINEDQQKFINNILFQSNDHNFPIKLPNFAMPAPAHRILQKNFSNTLSEKKRKAGSNNSHPSPKKIKITTLLESDSLNPDSLNSSGELTPPTGSPPSPSCNSTAQILNQLNLPEGNEKWTQISTISNDEHEYYPPNYSRTLFDEFIESHYSENKNKLTGTSIEDEKSELSTEDTVNLFSLLQNWK